MTIPEPTAPGPYWLTHEGEEPALWVMERSVVEIRIWRLVAKGWPVWSHWADVSDDLIACTPATPPPPPAAESELRRVALEMCDAIDGGEEDDAYRLVGEVRALLARPPAAPEPPPTLGWFSFDGENGAFEFHGTEEAARAAAQSALDYDTDASADGGWSEQVTDISYGRVIGRVREVPGARRDRTEDDPAGFDHITDYELHVADTPATPDTLDAAIEEARAAGLSGSVLWGSTVQSVPCAKAGRVVVTADVLDEPFAAMLRRALARAKAAREGAGDG